MGFRIQYSSTVPDHHFDVIYLEDGLVTKIRNLFGLGNEDSIDYIINWFSSRHYEYMDSKRSIITDIYGE